MALSSNSSSGDRHLCSVFYFYMLNSPNFCRGQPLGEVLTTEIVGLTCEGLVQSTGPSTVCYHISKAYETCLVEHSLTSEKFFSVKFKRIQTGQKNPDIT